MVTQKKAEHVCLIFSPIDTRYQDALTHYGPPLGLVALANYLEHRFPELRISILDGSVTHSVNSILEFIEVERPDIVAQSIQLISYSDALAIARLSKALGAITVFGGHHATQLAEVIALNQEGVVDFVVVHDGEEALADIVLGREPAEIPNLVFANGGRVHATPVRKYNIRAALPIDYTLLDLSPYRQRLRESGFTSVDPSVGNYTRVYSHKGCGNRASSGACIFCGRADKGVLFKTADQFWADAASVSLPNTTNYVFDVGDDFLNSESRLEALIGRRPLASNEIQFGIFGRANRVTDRGAQMLAKLNVKDVVIGFESGDEEVLARCGKLSTTPATNIRAAELLFGVGVDVCASFVLGMPGETSASIAKTIECARLIARRCEEILGRLPREIVANLIEPSPGSPAYEQLRKVLPEKYMKCDRLSLEEIQRDYFSVYFGLEDAASRQRFRRELASAAREIHNLVPFSDSQGWLSNEL